MDENMITNERAKALDWALKASLLLNEKYYPRIQKSIMKGDEGETEFKAVCASAGLSKDMTSALWGMLIGARATTKGYWA